MGMLLGLLLPTLTGWFEVDRQKGMVGIDCDWDDRSSAVIVEANR